MGYSQKVSYVVTSKKGRTGVTVVFVTEEL